MNRRIATGAAVFWVLAVVPATAEDAAYGALVSDPAAIRQLLVGNTLSGTMKETGKYWVEFYCATGKSIYYFDHQITLGKWRMRDDGQVCFRYDWDAYGYEGCYQLFENGSRDLTWVKTNDLPDDPATFLSGLPKPGDPLQLESRAHNGCKPEPSV